MDQRTLERLRRHIRGGEGNPSWPYLDSSGLITIGTGYNVDSLDQFLEQKMMIRDPQTGQIRKANDLEKIEAYKRLKAEPQDGSRSAKDFEQLTGLRLPQSEDERRLDEEIKTRIEKISQEVGPDAWERLNDGQKAAVLDVHYARGSLKDFPNLTQAIKDGDAEAIGRNVDFHGTNRDGSKQYNWDRLARNRAEAQGISFEDAQSQVEEDKRNGVFGLQHLRPEPRPQDQPLQPTPEPTPEPTPAPVTITPPPAPAPEPSPQAPSAQEQKKSNAPADPQVAAMTEMAATPINNPGRAALLKPVEKLTQPEMMDMIHSAQGDYTGWRSGDPLKAHTYEKVQDWHVAIYGDGPQANDGGKPIEPQPIRPIPEQPSPHTTPQGEDLWQATARLGGKVADAAGSDGYAQAVTGLQRGLNMLNQANPLPKRSPAYGPYTGLGPVDEDGKYGPQTDLALKHATARLGPAKVEEGLALGRFNTFARDAQRNGNPDGLEDKTHAIFGPLFRKDDQGPKVEGGVLQETLNDFGSRRRDDWEPLKVDNWIGPKTTGAFGDLLKSEDADTLIRSFGRGLGLL